MNVVYPLALDAFLRGDLDVSTDPVMVQPLTAANTYSAGHETVADLGTLAYTPVAAPSPSITDGALHVAPVTFPAVPAGPTITAVAVYLDTGAGQLLAYADQRADATPLAIVPDGSDITLSWPRVFKL